MKFSKKGIKLEFAKNLLRKDSTGNFYFDLPEVETPEELKKMISFFFGINQNEIHFRFELKIKKEVLTRKNKLIRKLDIINGISDKTHIDVGYVYFEPFILKLLTDRRTHPVSEVLSYVNLLNNVTFPDQNLMSGSRYGTGDLYNANYKFIKECLQIRNINYHKFYLAFFRGIFKKYDIIIKQHNFEVYLKNPDPTIVIDYWSDDNKIKYYSEITKKEHPIDFFGIYTLYLKAITDQEKQYYTNFNDLIIKKDNSIRDSFKKEFKKLKELNEKT